MAEVVVEVVAEVAEVAEVVVEAVVVVEAEVVAELAEVELQICSEHLPSMSVLGIRSPHALH